MASRSWYIQRRAYRLVALTFLLSFNLSFARHTSSRVIRIVPFCRHCVALPRRVVVLTVGFLVFAPQKQINLPFLSSCVLFIAILVSWILLWAASTPPTVTISAHNTLPSTASVSCHCWATSSLTVACSLLSTTEHTNRVHSHNYSGSDWTTDRFDWTSFHRQSPSDADDWTVMLDSSSPNWIYQNYRTRCSE